MIWVPKQVYTVLGLQGSKSLQPSFTSPCFDPFFQKVLISSKVLAVWLHLNRPQVACSHASNNATERTSVRSPLQGWSSGFFIFGGFYNVTLWLGCLAQIYFGETMQGPGKPFQTLHTPCHSKAPSTPAIVNSDAQQIYSWTSVSEHLTCATKHMPAAQSTLMFYATEGPSMETSGKHRSKTKTLQ